MKTATRLSKIILMPLLIISGMVKPGIIVSTMMEKLDQMLLKQIIANWMTHYSWFMI